MVIFTLALSASALTTPQYINHHHHRAIAAKVVAPPQVEIEVRAPQGSGAGKTLRRRASNSKRCKNPAASKAASETPVVTPTLKDSQPAVTPKTTKTTTTHTTSTKTSAAAAATTTKKVSGSISSGNEPSFMTGTQTGQGTYYGTGLGACGITNKDTDMIAAVSHLLYDTYPGYNYAAGNPNNNPICGKKVTATYKGKSVTVAVTDRCQGCAITDLDFAPSAFNKIADPALGRISGMTWVWA